MHIKDSITIYNVLHVHASTNHVTLLHVVHVVHVVLVAVM